MCRRANKWKETAHLRDLIKLYFMLGVTHGAILSLLSRILKPMGLHRRKNQFKPLDVASFVIGQLEGAMEMSYSTSATSTLSGFCNTTNYCSLKASSADFDG